MDTYTIFRQLNAIPRPSHHEGRVADFLCDYARRLGLDYSRDAQNCVVIRKPATPGYEDAEPVVLLNHMDMVAVGDGSRPFNPLEDAIEAYVEDGWMKARGTSLGADNGIGLSMALAVLADDTLVHGPLEVLTTTNEEDGMSGAANLSSDFIKGRKVINLDSEDYDTITVGAAGAYLQEATFPIERMAILQGSHCFYRLTVSGGQGGHSGVDINKGRINAIRLACELLSDCNVVLSDIQGGSANASIPGDCMAVIGVGEDEAQGLKDRIARTILPETEPYMRITLEPVEAPDAIIKDGTRIVELISNLPCGPLRMRDDMPGTVMTSNNIGVVRTIKGGGANSDAITISCHTRSFSDAEMEQVAHGITAQFTAAGASVEVMMNTPGWQENKDSQFLQVVGDTFYNILGFRPRPVAMHFVLEAGYYVQKYPGIEIACIGPRIIEPHSTKERVELSTVDDIWQVLVALLKRLSTYLSPKTMNYKL